VLRVRGLVKTFGATKALRDASFELRRGEVHALIGENGSGKSTFVKILSGVHSPDGGEIEMGGLVVDAPRTPARAQARGINTVFQEVLVAGARSVLDNVWLGAETSLRARASRAEREQLATEMLHELCVSPPPLETLVEELSLSHRQACAAVRALLRNPEILILDEATSALDVATRDRLFEIVARMTAAGTAVIFITHRLDEVAQIGDRITVMRSGRTVATLGKGEWTRQQLIHLMTGSDHLTAGVSARGSTRSKGAKNVVLRATDLLLRPDSDPINVEIRQGELVGVAGLDGHGQDQFLGALYGAEAAAAGEIMSVDNTQETAIKSPTHAAKNGIFYVPRERGRESAFSWMSVRENFGLPTFTVDSRLGWINRKGTKRRLSYYVDRLNIVLGDPSDRITTLSGGNQQKVMIARWLAANPRLLILNDPTRGIDIGAKRDLYKLVTALASEGLAVVMLSTEIDEHVELMDRVLVFREHALFREVDREDLSPQLLVSAFFGEVPTDG
jgi:ABC-type sugar transport system ATPase subunit